MSTTTTETAPNQWRHHLLSQISPQSDVNPSCQFSQETTLRPRPSSRVSLQARRRTSQCSFHLHERYSNSAYVDQARHSCRGRRRQIGEGGSYCHYSYRRSPQENQDR